MPKIYPVKCCKAAILPQAKLFNRVNKLPYFQIRERQRSGEEETKSLRHNNTQATNKVARFLLRKIKKRLQNKNPYHYLIFAKRYQYLNFIKKNSKKFPYFLKIDIEKYYPSFLDCKT